MSILNQKTLTRSVKFKGVGLHTGKNVSMTIYPSKPNTGITFKISESWFLKMEEKNQREIMKEITTLLVKENVAYDINGYPKAPPSFRIWGGGTVEPEDVNKLLPWIDWAYKKCKIS